ncbi:helix-turn-helix transcriptional regulator [Trichocoleus sp. FACHB-832]|nr:helix-turn-helix transcriptional regulator [Trichocoleus sp. FACHB-832]
MLRSRRTQIKNSAKQLQQESELQSPALLELARILYARLNEQGFEFPNEIKKSYPELEKFLTTKLATFAAEALLEQINFKDLPVEDITALLGIQKQPIPVTEPKLSTLEEIPSSSPFRVGVESCYRTDKWKNSPDNWGVFESPCKNKPSNSVEVYISGGNDGEILALEAALQIIDLIGIDAAKLQLVFASHLLNQPNPCLAKFSLKGSEVIKQIGWDKKHRLTVSEKLAQLASISFHLGRMLMSCTWVEGKPKGNKVNASVSVSPLWVVKTDVIGQKNLLTGKVEQPDEIYITVSPGPWVDSWLNRVGARAGTALCQFGWLATNILKIDPYHDELALKLAIHLTMLSRIKARDIKPYEHKVGELLEAVELESRINAARLDKYKARDLKNDWNNALSLLKSLGWRVMFDDATYPEWLRPNREAEKPSGWKEKKIIDWLWKAKLTIKPPEPIPALLATKSEPLQLKPVTSKSEPILTGADIRKQREAKGVSQTALAEWAGKTKAWLCMVEKGKRKIGPKEAKELWAGIDFLANKLAQP